ncbi:MAG: ROK family protein [Actinomycetota bacterium]
MKTLALDIGATKIAIAILDSQHVILNRFQVSSNGSEEIWPELLTVLKDFDVDLIGVASAGPIDQAHGTISPVNIPQWRKFPIAQKLGELFPDKPVGLLGDCTAVALAENKLGAGAGTKNMLGVVVSTGIGGGLVLDGKAFHGETGNAALFGHHSIGFNSGVICDCGRTGCLETFARGPKMVEYAMRNGWTAGSDFIALAASARTGDQLAIEAIDRGALALAVGITNVLMITDIHTVVIGGGVSFAGAIYWEPFLAHFENECRLAGFLDDVAVHPAKLKQDAGLIGASLFAHEFAQIDSANA